MKLLNFRTVPGERPPCITWSPSPWFFCWSGPRGEENVNKITRGQQESRFFRLTPSSSSSSSAVSQQRQNRRVASSSKGPKRKRATHTASTDEEDKKTVCARCRPWLPSSSSSSSLSVKSGRRSARSVGRGRVTRPAAAFASPCPRRTLLLLLGFSFSSRARVSGRTHRVVSRVPSSLSESVCVIIVSNGGAIQRRQ